MRSTTIRKILIALEVFVGIMAIYGGARLLADATWFGVQEEWLRGSPFTNYQIPAVGLMIGVAGSSLLAATVLLRRHDTRGDLLSMGAGLVLMGFEIIETYSFGLRNFQQPFMFVMGLLIVALGAMQWRSTAPHDLGRLPLSHAH